MIHTYPSFSPRQLHAICSYKERWDFPTDGSSLILPRFSLLTFSRFLGLFFIFSEIFTKGSPSSNLSPIFLLVQIQLVWLLVGSLVRLLVGKSYHTKQKDGYSLPTNDSTNNHVNWIWMSKKIGLRKVFIIFAVLTP